MNRRILNLVQPIDLMSSNCTIDMRVLINHKDASKRIDDDDIEKLIKIIPDVTQDEDLRFKALYIALTYYRIMVSLSEYNALKDKYINLFDEGKYPLKYIVLAHYHNNLRDSANAIKYSKIALERIPNIRGVKQTFADFVAAYIEKEDHVLDDELKSLVLLALKKIDEEIEIDDRYAKYYCTKGRLLYYSSNGKEFETASSLMSKAIDIEKPTRPDHAIRTAQYYFYLTEIRVKESARKQMDEFREMIDVEVDKTKEILDTQKSKYLEILAFFASMIAIIIGAVINIQSIQTFKQSASLLLLLTGALMVSYGGFRLLFSYNNDKKINHKTVIVAVVSIIMILLGCYLGVKSDEKIDEAQGKKEQMDHFVGNSNDENKEMINNEENVRRNELTNSEQNE